MTLLNWKSELSRFVIKETSSSSVNKCQGTNDEVVTNCSRQIGAEAMTCECANGYVGRNCEIHLLDTVDGGRICPDISCIMYNDYENCLRTIVFIISFTY